MKVDLVAPRITWEKPSPYSHVPNLNTKRALHCVELAMESPLNRDHGSNHRFDPGLSV